MRGSELLGQATLREGAATLPDLRLGVGNNELTASYSGDSMNEASKSAIFKQMVSASTTCRSNRLIPQPIRARFGSLSQ